MFQKQELTKEKKVIDIFLPHNGKRKCMQDNDSFFPVSIDSFIIHRLLENRYGDTISVSMYVYGRYII